MNNSNRPSGNSHNKDHKQNLNSSNYEVIIGLLVFIGIILWAFNPGLFSSQPKIEISSRVSQFFKIYDCNPQSPRTLECKATNRISSQLSKDDITFIGYDGEGIRIGRGAIIGPSSIGSGESVRLTFSVASITSTSSLKRLVIGTSDGLDPVFR